MRLVTTVACMVAFAAAILASLGYASTVRDFKGPVTGGGRIAFSAERQQGRFFSVGLFSVTRVPVTCDEGDTKYSHARTETAVHIKHRKFHYDFARGTAVAKITGKFNRKFSKAKGEFRVAH
ncbi:MAG TPA: hypothetical protein VN458_02290, partial [Solirubrobacterales bacterium]|nr:hypothetical protein [Solirubrobacterales bacterium]